MVKRLLIAFGLVVVSAAAMAAGHDSKLRMPSFSHLEGKAVEAVDISFGRVPLQLASWFIPDEDPDSAQVKRLLKGMKSVAIRHFRFDSDFAYSMSDIDGVRAQLAEKGWSPLVQVRDRRKDEDVDVFVSLDDDKITGVAIVASEPREFTIVNIDGTLDMDQIEAWRAQFNEGSLRDRWTGGRHGPRGDMHRDRNEDRGTRTYPDRDAGARADTPANENIAPVETTVAARL